MVEEEMPWVKSAKMWHAGAFLVVIPPDNGIGDAFIVPVSRPYYPMFILKDSNSNGIPNWIQIVDSKMRSVNLVSKHQDGVWDSFIFSTGMDSNSVTLIDTNMDGTFDRRMGPSRQ